MRVLISTSEGNVGEGMSSVFSDTTLLCGRRNVITTQFIKIQKH